MATVWVRSRSDLAMDRDEKAGRWTQAHLGPATAVILALVGVAAVSIGDLVTGPYLVFATFYLGPVALAAWFAGRRAALIVAVVAAVAGVVSTALNPRDVSAPIYAWNGCSASSPTPSWPCSSPQSARPWPRSTSWPQRTR
jgi:hypothetical protein